MAEKQTTITTDEGTFAKDPDTGEWVKISSATSNDESPVNYDDPQSIVSSDLSSKDKANALGAYEIGLAEESLAIYGDLAAMQIQIAETQTAIMEEQWNRYLEIYGPVEEQWVNEATVGLPQDYFVARASADVKQGFAQQRQQLANTLSMYGIDPSSPKFASLSKDLAIAEAAADAGARTNARLTINDVNYQRKSDVVKTGRGIPTEAASIGSSASAATGAAANTYQQGYGNVLSATQNMAGYYQNKNMAQMQADAQTSSAMWGAVGSIVGTGAGIALAPATGGASLAATPAASSVWA